MMRSKYGWSMDSVVSDFSMSRSGILEKSFRKRTKSWIIGIIVACLLFFFGSLWTIMWINDSNSLKKFPSRSSYQIELPSNNILDTWKTVKAVILILCRNSDLETMMTTIINFEQRFNKKFRYPYVFLNNEPFTETFKNKILEIIPSSTKVHFGIVPIEHWSYPSWIDKKKVKETRKTMSHVMYGGSESYRFMCRYYSGFFYKHPLLQSFEFYWRLEPGVKYSCNINYDVFKFMKRKNLKYGYTIMMNEISETIPTLWKTVINNQISHSRQFEKSMMTKIGTQKWYSGCHFWNNFEIASFEMLRSFKYQQYFDNLDKAGGFFYERWGDAPVRTMAVALFLNPEEVHYFEDIGYQHDFFSHCPPDFELRKDLQCDCDPADPGDISDSPCLSTWALREDSQI